MAGPARHVAIVGAGISGLSTAFYLQRHRVPATLFEQEARLGGLIRTDNVFDCTLEAGPDSFLAAKPALRQLAADLHLQHDLIPSNDAQRKIFIVRNGQLVPLPHGMAMMVPAQMETALQSPLFSEAAKQRFLQELKTPPRDRTEDFTVRTLVEDHFGPELLDFVAEPLLAGVYGGDPGNLSAPSVLPRFVEYEQTFGSLIAGAQQERRTAGAAMFLSFRGGMGQVISALQARISAAVPLRTEEALEITRDPAGTWRLRTTAAEYPATDIVLAVPAYRAARLLQGVDAALSAELSSIPYSSAILANLLFPEEAFAHPLNGFGFLVPRPERRLVAAATWINTKFPCRAAPGKIAIRVFIVEPEASGEMQTPDAALISAVRADLKRLMGIETQPLYTSIHRWPQSMPQYVVGHASRRARILASLEELPGLHLVSNYLDGVGIPDCVRWARSAAAAVRDTFESS